MRNEQAAVRLPGDKRLRGIIFDLDGTFTPVRSVWQYIHEALDTWESHGKHSLDAFLAGRITYEEFAYLDAGAWRGVSRG